MQVDGDEISAVLPDLIPGLEYRIKIISVLDGIESIPATATFIARVCVLESVLISFKIFQNTFFIKVFVKKYFSYRNN